MKTLRLSITLPMPLEDIIGFIIFKTVELFGSQKEAALNLGICEATVSRRLNRRRRRKANGN